MTTQKLKREIVFKLIFYAIVFGISLLAACIIQKVENMDQARTDTEIVEYIC